jgi:uncharacterized protein involved in exopolysaccharide biosynthesis
MTSFSPVSMVPSPASAETVDVAELARSVVRRWRAVLLATALGVAAAFGVLVLAPRRFTGSASLLLRSTTDPTGSILSRVGIPTDLAPTALGNSLKSPLETELQILVSRDVLGTVVDSLGLQARVLGRAGVPSRALVVPTTYPGSFRRRTYTFERQRDGRYRVSGPDTALLAAPGSPVRLPIVGPVTIAPAAPLARFQIKFEDREDAITRLSESLGVDKKGGEVAGLTYAGPDSLTAAAVPNAIVSTYLDRRRTVDRGVNERRYEFLRLQADSVARQLANAEDALRRLQEQTGVLDPEFSGRLGAEAARTLREQVGAVEVERHALGQLIAQVAAATVSPRQLAAYPSFLKSDAINALLTQMATLETERTRLLERRTERDPEVIAIAASVENLERQLAPLARAYASSLDRQAEELDRQLAVVESRLAALPGQAEASLQGQRDVKLLSSTFAGLQAQIVDARLAAIGEGGQVRRIDVAEPPKKPSFPRPTVTLLLGTLGGLLVGVVWALGRGALDGRLWSRADVERVTGLPVFVVHSGAPLLLGAGVRSGTVVVVRVDGAPDGASTAVAAAIASEVEERGRHVAVVEASRHGSSAAFRAAVADAEVTHPLVVVAGDSVVDARTVALLDPPRAALLVAASGTPREAIVDAYEVIARLAVPCLGVALVAPTERRRASAPVELRPSRVPRVAAAPTAAAASMVRTDGE